jgi:integrase
LTAVRTGDAIGAKLDQFDFDEKLWRIPRTKNGKPLRVPLAPRALAIMKQMAAQRDADERADDFMFPGDVPGKGFSNNAMLKLLERMGVRDEAVTHGFRATFKTWATEETRHAREVIELSIAHTVTNKVEAAYLRGDLLVKRRKLMDDWERFCGTIGRVGGTVAHLHRQVS